MDIEESYRLCLVRESGKFNVARASTEGCFLLLQYVCNPSPYSLRRGAYPIFHRCELIFILFATGIPEPSDRECQEGSHFVSCSELYYLRIMKSNYGNLKQFYG